MRPSCSGWILLLALAVPAVAQPPIDPQTDEAEAPAAEPAASQAPPAAPQAPPELTPEQREAAATVQRAVQLAGEGDFAGAIALLEPLGERTETPAFVRGLLGTLYIENGQQARALETLQPLAEDEDADPAVLYNAGRAAAALGRSDLAERFLQRSLELVPSSPAVREMGMLRARQGRYFEAYRFLGPWARINPDDDEARQIAAFCAVQLERPTEAEELLSDLPQDNPRVRLLWGKLLMQKNDPWGASATLKPLLESAPEAMQGDLRTTLAEAYMAMGEAASAVEVLATLPADNPSTALLLALAEYQAGELEAALATLDPFASRLIAGVEQGVDPADPLEQSLISEHGRLLATAGRHAEALPYLEAATRLKPDNKQAWQQLGQALVALGRRDEASAALERFQQIVQSEVPNALEDVQLGKDIQDPTGRQLREAIAALARGDVEKALIIARREAQLAPRDLRPRLVEGKILLSAGRSDEALELSRALAEAAPGNADAHYLLGTVLMGRQEMAEAEREFRQALEISPEHTAAMNDLAVLLMESGATTAARELLERVLELRPGDELATRNLQRLEAGES